jgi:GNAT superfamily N-acetyltransferase
MHLQSDDPAYTWEITEHPGDTTSILRQHLGAFNVERAQIDQSQDLAIFLSDRQGELMAGIVGWIWGECLEIAYLWVHAALRGQGYGTQLMERLEAEALARGCQVCALDTFSFQAQRSTRSSGMKSSAVLEAIRMAFRSCSSGNSFAPQRPRLIERGLPCQRFRYLRVARLAV